MKICSMKNAIWMVSVCFVLTSCGGGSGGGGGNVFSLNGNAVSGSLSLQAPSQIYTFNAVADTPYTVSVATSSGDTILQVFNGNLTLANLSAGGNVPIGWSWNSTATTPYNTVSFIATVTGPVTIAVTNASFSGVPASYTLQAYSGNLSVGASHAGATYNAPTYWSFDATAGTAYKVQVSPSAGNVNISSVYPKMGTSLGSSTLTGTTPDIVTFQAAASQRYYVNVAATSASSTFDVQVMTTSANPDLSVVVDSVTSDGSNVTVNYTVRNGGINAAGAFDVQLWSNSAARPAAGSMGQGSATHASLAGGATVSGSVVIPNAGSAGTAYVAVDSLGAVAEADEQNNVSVGATWETPLIAPQNFNFENGVVPVSLKMTGNAVWGVDTTTGSASTRSLRAGAIGNSQASCVALSAINAQSISFDYAVSSEGGFDYLKFYIDGVVQWNHSWSGTVNWSPSGLISVTSGFHEYKWCYSKDFTISSGLDTAWIDNIVLTAAPAPTIDLAVTVDSAISNGSAVTVSYTVTNLGNSVAGPFNVDFWSNGLGAPVVGSIGQASIAHASLAAGASTTGTATINTVSASGTAYAIVDTANAVVESVETNNVSAGFLWTASIDLQAVVTSVVSDRNNVTVNYRVSNPGANAAGAFRIDVWSNAVTAPVVGMLGEAFATIASLPAGGTVNGSLTVPNTGAGGTAYAVVDTLAQVAEGVESNNVSAGIAWVAPALAPLSFNFDNSLVPVEMAMSGNALWLPARTGNGGNTVLSLQAGLITHTQTSCVAVNAANSFSASFSYSVSSEASFDFLKFYIDGTLKASWSGAVAWTASTPYTAATVGVHEFKWCYTKDGSISSGSDTAWIDNVVIN